MSRVTLHTALGAALLAPSLTAQLVFEPAVSVDLDQTGSFYVASTVGDVDGDGFPDVVTGQGCCVSGPIELLLNQGDGTLGAPGIVDDDFAGVLQLVDFDGDGVLDLVTAGQGASVRMGLLGALFGPPTQIATGFSDPRQLSVADLNGDGHLDVIVSRGSLVPASGSVVFIPGQGDGTFGVSSSIDSYVGFQPSFTAVGDIDEDGERDLVVSLNNIFASQLRVYRNLGIGAGFAPPLTLGLSSGGYDHALLNDLNGDQHLDLALFTESGFGVKLGNGDLTFQGSVLLSSDNLTEGALSDFDGDGHADAVAYDREGDKLSIFRGAGDGSFAKGLDLTGMKLSTGGRLDVADFDGDGLFDIGRAEPDAPSRYEVFLNHTYGPGEPWLDLGQGLADASPSPDALPILLADGSLEANAPYAVTVARNGVLAEDFFMILGLSELSSPFKGGTLVPDPGLVVGPLSHDPSGVLTISGTLPAAIPASTEIFIQFWWVPSGPGSTHAATNAARGTVQ